VAVQVRAPLAEEDEKQRSPSVERRQQRPGEREDEHRRAPGLRGVAHDRILREEPGERRHAGEREGSDAEHGRRGRQIAA
jgi:hypothetical protein